MRTTVSIDDEIHEAARRIAFETRRTLGEVVNELLALGLRQKVDGAPKRQLGQLRGSIRIADDFDETPDEVIAAFEADV